MNHAELENRFLAQEEFLGRDKPVNRIQPVVSVSVTTYQHAAFIHQCLDGILMQKTSFPFELIIGEDESTDGTREICIEYAEKHPDRIRLFLRSRALSVYVEDGATRRLNGAWCRRSARGTYIAMCEGDDYWTSPDKLQKQIDFLESHPECSMSFHNVLIVSEEPSEAPRPAYSYDMRPFYHLIDLFPRNFIHTPSVVFRRDALPQPRPDWCRLMPMGDWPTYLLLAQNGRLAYLPDVMSAYRRHSGGIWSQMSRSQWLDKSTFAAETVLREFVCRLPKMAGAAAMLRRDVLGMYLEQRDYRAASVHARKLLGYTSRRYLSEIRSLSCRYLADMGSLLSTIWRAYWPRRRLPVGQAKSRDSF